MKWILLLGYSILVAGCAYATGNAVIQMSVDRKLDVDATLNKEQPAKVKEKENDRSSS